jgi:glutamine amidotransferase
VKTSAEIRKAKAVILPGVGAFAQAMQHLTRQRLIGSLREAAEAGKPFLGICLGMQLMFDYSEEFGRHDGLSLLPGKVVPFSKNVKVPHMGWNQITLKSKNPYFKDVPNQSYMYFVHSFYCVPSDPQDVVTTTDYGVTFASTVGRNRLCGIQFHPEKSQNTGLLVYRNLANMLAQTR